MKQIILLLTMLFVLGALFVPQEDVTAFAEEGAEESTEEELSSAIDELLSELDLTELQEYLDTLLDFRGASVMDSIRSVIDGNFALDYDTLGEALLALLSDELLRLLPAFAMILALALICGLLDCNKNGILHSNMSDTIRIVGYISVGCVALALFIQAFSAGFSCMRSLRTQMEIVFPILMTLMAASGGSVSAAVFRPGVAFLSGAVLELFFSIVFPINIISIVLTFVDRLSPDVRCSRLGDFLKSINKWLIGLTLTLFGIMLSVQGIASAQYDGISLRAIKYVISGSVPIVGGFLSGSVDFVLAGSLLIRNAIGSFSILMLLAVVLQPLILFAAVQLMLRLSAAATEPIGGEIPGFLSALARDMGYFIAGLLTIAFLYFLTVLLLVCSAGVFL